MQKIKDVVDDDPAQYSLPHNSSGLVISDLRKILRKFHPEQKINAITAGGKITERSDFLPFPNRAGAPRLLHKPFEICNHYTSVKQVPRGIGSE